MKELLYRMGYLAIFGWGIRRIIDKVFFVSTKDPSIAPPGYYAYALGYQPHDGPVMWWWVDTNRDTSLKRYNNLVSIAKIQPTSLVVKGVHTEKEADDIEITSIHQTPRNMLPTDPNAIVNAGCRGILHP